MSDSTQKFVSHFKMPKSEQNRIKKEYSTAKEASEKIDPSKYINFKELADEVFNVYEEIAGRKVNRDLVLGHLSYYFDEGFIPKEMILYLQAKIAEDFFKQKPELFTIAILFPVKDQDRINAVWDHLSYFQGILNKTAKEKQGPLVQMPCGHFEESLEWRNHPYCKICVMAGDSIEVARNPYAPEVPNELEAFAEFFKRRGEESFTEYQERTMSELKKLNDSYKRTRHEPSEELSNSI